MKLTNLSFRILHSALCFALAAALSASGDNAATSAGGFVFVNADTSSYWHTATNATLALPVEFPAGVSSATLTVTAPSYAASYEIAASGDFTLTLPAATSPTTENVYDLALDFGNGAVRTAKLGLIKGYDTTTTGETRCLAPKEQRKWGWVRGRAVLPIPYGMTAFTVDGVATDTGLNGAQGWYPLCLKSGETANLALDALSATLFRLPEATVFELR